MRSAQRLPTSPPDAPESFAAVLADLDRVLLPGHDALAEPAVLRVLRDHGVGARGPRRARDRGAEPGRNPLAHVAGARRSSRSSLSTGCASSLGLAGRVRTATSRTRPRRRRSPRSLAARRSSRIGASSCAPSTRTRRWRRPRGCSGSSCGRCRPTTSSGCGPTCSTRGRVRRRRHGRDDRVGVRRSGSGDRRRGARPRVPGSTSTPRTPDPPRSARSFRRPLRRLGASGLDRSSIRTSGSACRWTARSSGRADRTLPRRVLLVPEYLRVAEDASRA